MGKENEYLWRKEALTEIELIVDSTEQDRQRLKMMINRKSMIQESKKVIGLKIK
ncbi:MAG: hypothetical protein O4751_06035 [Trichodesmium sp. St2_bin6]|nr:hypothetical protein [Trichodesmium sp. MAG_R01]MDE5077842.1 hypothetical protein [Trichodesmium sp. St2_bin6]